MSIWFFIRFLQHRLCLTQGFENAFKGTGVSGYPGGPFNPLGLGNSSKESMDDFKWREIRNARLAMVAFLGFLAQHAATGKGPIDNLADHLADPVSEHVVVKKSMGCDSKTPKKNWMENAVFCIPNSKKV
jgi:hypothetical protein